MFEHKSEPLIPPKAFVARSVRSALYACSLVAATLVVGTMGYHWTADLAWIDALLNASMILTGMGPVNPLTTTESKLFAICYCLLCGLVVVYAFVITSAPLLHRLLHRFHLEAGHRHKPT
jgi:hypothetical protein